MEPLLFKQKPHTMNIKTFKFDYGFNDAEVHFDVDLDKFTEDMAKATLEFFSWDDEPDYDNDLIEEAMKKYARMAIMLGAFKNLSLPGIIREFKNLEGYGGIDGSIGVTCTYFAGHEFEVSQLGFIE